MVCSKKVVLDEAVRDQSPQEEIQKYTIANWALIRVRTRCLQSCQRLFGRFYLNHKVIWFIN